MALDAVHGQTLTLFLQDQVPSILFITYVKVFHVKSVNSSVVGGLPAADNGRNGAGVKIWWWVGSCPAAPQSLPV